MSLQFAGEETAAFKAALGAFASSVNVITMWDDNHNALGMTATAFSSVSLEPLLILVCVNRSTRTYEQVVKNQHFAVNILSSTAREVSDFCSRPGSDKYLPQSWLTETEGQKSPALAGALACLDCEVEHNLHAGTHAVLIGAVKSIGLSQAAHDAEPLLHFRGAYRQLAALAERPQPRPLPII